MSKLPVILGVSLWLMLGTCSSAAVVKRFLPGYPSQVYWPTFRWENFFKKSNDVSSSEYVDPNDMKDLSLDTDSTDNVDRGYEPDDLYDNVYEDDPTGEPNLEDTDNDDDTDYIPNNTIDDYDTDYIPNNNIDDDDTDYIPNNTMDDDDTDYIPSTTIDDDDADYIPSTSIDDDDPDYIPNNTIDDDDDADYIPSTSIDDDDTNYIPNNTIDDDVDKDIDNINDNIIGDSDVDDQNTDVSDIDGSDIDDSDSAVSGNYDDHAIDYHDFDHGDFDDSDTDTYDPYNNLIDDDGDDLNQEPIPDHLGDIPFEDEQSDEELDHFYEDSDEPLDRDPRALRFIPRIIKTGAAAFRGMRARNYLLKGTMQTRHHGITRHYDKAGGKDQMLKDFYFVQPTKLSDDLIDGHYVGKIGVVGDTKVHYFLHDAEHVELKPLLSLQKIDGNGNIVTKDIIHYID